MTEPTPTTPQPAATIKVPGIGAMPRRYVIIGAAVVVGVVGFAYLRRARQPSAVFDPATGSQVEPLPDGYTNPVPNPPASGVLQEQPGVIGSDAEWSAKAVEELRNTSWDAQYVSIVLGKYLAGSPLTPDEVNVVRAAEALVGKAPSGIQIVPIPNQPTTPAPEQPQQVPSTQPKRRYVIVVPFTGTPKPWRSYVDGIRGQFGRSRENITSWNPSVRPPEYVIHPGQKIYVDPPGNYSGETEVR